MSTGKHDLKASITSVCCWPFTAAYLTIVYVRAYGGGGERERERERERESESASRNVVGCRRTGMMVLVCDRHTMV